jgi:apolipoprotein N-acyltransferase
MPRDLLLFASSLSALALAFPPFRLGFFACWALIPFFLLLENKSAGAAFRWGYGAGLLINMITMHLSFLVPSMDRLLAVLAMPLGYGLLAVLLAGLHKQWPSGYLFAAPVLWIIIEYVLTQASSGMAGLPLGYTQEYYASLLRNLFGESIFFVSFWVVTINALLLMAWRHRDNLYWLAGLGALLAGCFLLPYAVSKLAWRNFNFFHEKVIEVRRAPSPVTPYQAAQQGEAQELFAFLGF